LCVRVIFARRMKTQQKDEIVIKKYVVATDVYEFGPLIIGKSREK